MKIQSLYIDGFGKFQDLSLSFSEGLNVIYGQNEAGKSTLHSFLRAMLYGLERRPGRQDSFHRFRPWKEDASFGGSLVFHFLDSLYLLRRDFSDGKGAPRIFKLQEGTLPAKGPYTPSLLTGLEGSEELTDSQALLSSALAELSESAYRNTVSIGQLKAATGREMVQELRHYLSSLQGSGSSKLDAAKALELLEAEKKSCQGKLVTEASKNYSILIGEIRNIERELSDPHFHNLLNHYSELKEEAVSKREKLQSEKEELLQKTAREKEALLSAGFSEEAELKKQSEDSEKLYQSFQDLKEKLAKQSGFQLFLKKLFSAFQTEKTDSAENEAETRLSEILKKQLGESSISEDSMKQLRQRFSTLEKNFQALNEKEEELGQLSEDLKQNQEEEKKYETALEEQHEIRTEVEGKLQHLCNIKNRVDQLEKILAENEKLMQKIDALDLAMETISELSERVRLSFGRYLNDEAGELIEKITNGAYHSVWIDDQLNVLLNTEEGEVPLESVSSGTMDQIYLALRLATARLFLKDAPEVLPLSFDDSFALYDEKRLAATLRFIKQEYEGQILIFSCHKREQQLLKKAKEEFKLIEL